MSYKQYNFIRVATATPLLQLANCEYNREQLVFTVKQAAEKGADFLVTPELGMTGYTCGDLFLQQALLKESAAQLSILCQETKDEDIIFTVGLPIFYKNKIYNCAAIIHAGKLLGLVPKTNLPNYSEFYEQRQFTPAFEGLQYYSDSYFKEIPFSVELLFKSKQNPLFTFALELCEDLWVPSPPSIRHSLVGALVIANLSAGNELVGKAEYRRTLVSNQSAKLNCAYLYASAGVFESTTDAVFAGHNIIAENGTILAESALFSSEIIFTEIDLERLSHDRSIHNTFPQINDKNYVVISFSQNENPKNSFLRNVSSFPFVPQNPLQLQENCETIYAIQAIGLRQRIIHTKAQSLVVGLSGGLDSTLALLVCLKAIKNTPLSKENIIAITMPAFGTTERTKSNAEILAKIAGVTFRTISISDSVRQHFKDISHNENDHSVVYENAQARMRTLVLMDIANAENGLVVGTGDLSELALGWATYNGDHMSMYGVNSSVPKTLVRHLVEYEANKNKKLQKVLLDILATPVSPELLPAVDGKISQQTEELVGPYELHDFVLYYTLRWGFSPTKIYFLEQIAFKDKYSTEIMLHWLKIFYRRFFASQFKRSCLPDGAKVGSVCLSPRADWRMPSDAIAEIWLKEVEQLGKDTQ